MVSGGFGTQVEKIEVIFGPRRITSVPKKPEREEFENSGFRLRRLPGYGVPLLKTKNI